MDSLRVEQKDDSPLIDFNPKTGVFLMEGESRPENASKYYSPVLKWLNEYFETADKSKAITFVFKLDYFNSSSAKYLMDIMLILTKFIDNGAKIFIEWHYDVRDEDMLESGKEFSSKFSSNINMKMVKY